MGIRVKISGTFLPVTATRTCGPSWPESSSRRSPAICPKAVCRAAWKVKRGHWIRTKMRNLFPMFMKLEGKRCLVVGAGNVGEPKIGSLIDTGARVGVIALQASETVKAWAQAGKITLEPRAFSAEDLDGKFLAVVATASRALNGSIYREAQRRGVLCNVVDGP